LKPLKDQLKAARTKVRAVFAAPEPAPKPPEPEPDFKLLFKDVRPLKAQGRVLHTPPRPSAKPRFGQTRLPSSLSEAERAALFNEMSGWFEPAEIDVHHAKPGMPNATLKKLRHGHWPVVAELDLHGLDRYTAQERIALFLHRAQQHGQCVRIIHGKGFGSNGEPVLKRMVRSWLKYHPQVLAYCEAEERFGGTGALMVLLKSRRFPSKQE
jgi:DNA-nicking Smr family endonuclease